MIDLGSLTNLNGQQIIIFFFKAFSLIFSIMYFVYSIVVLRQTQIMLKTIQIKEAGVMSSPAFITLLSTIQLIVGIILLIFSFSVLVS